MNGFKFSIDDVQQTYLSVSLEGRLVDESEAQDMLHQIDAKINDDKTQIIIDLKLLEYINSSGLNSLVNILTKSRSNGGDVILSQLSEKVKSLFIVTKLNTVFTVAESKAEAIKMMLSKQEEE